jgi:predicted cobalt transporter CbtA
LPNTPQAPLVERRLRWAGFLIAVGLIVQLTTFIWIHPLAFIAFAVIGCPLVAAGVLLFLYSLVSHQPSQGGNPSL